MPLPENPCTLATGVKETACFDCLPRIEKKALIAYFLAQTIKALDGPDYTDQAVLRKATACFCVPSSRLDSFEVGVFLQLAEASGADVGNLSIAELKEAIRCWTCGATVDTFRMEAIFLLCQLGVLIQQVPCWVAREVYGWNNPKWIVFADWLLNTAPRWFRKLYLAQGRSFAAWIADKPGVKRIVRWLMDKVTHG